MPSEQPSILRIQADQPVANMLAALGAPPASTPHIDALGARGSVFVAADTLEIHDLRSDRNYARWAYVGILEYRFAEE